MSASLSAFLNPWHKCVIATPYKSLPLGNSPGKELGQRITQCWHSSTWVGLGRTESVLNHWNIQVTGGSLNNRWPSDASGLLCLLYWFAVLMGIYGWLLLFSHSVMSDFFRPYGLWYVRLPCPSPSPVAYSNSCPLSQWCHPIISSSAIPFSCLQSFPVSGSFLMSWLFASCGQSTGVSASASVLLMNIQDWFPLGLTGLSSLQSKELSRVFSNTTAKKYQFLWCLAFFIVQLSHPYMTTGKTIALTRWTFVSKVMSLLFNMLSRFVIAFLPRSKHLLIYGCNHHLQWF